MTNNNLFSKVLLRLATSTLLAASAAVVYPHVTLADAPTWLKQAATAPKPNVPPETVAVILYDEQETTVQSNGQVEEIYRRAYLILRPDGKELGILHVPFDNETKITSIRGWCIPKDGKDYEVKDKDAIETGRTEEFYSDDRMKTIEIPAALPGNVIGYEYHQKARPFFLQDMWRFQTGLPVVLSRFTLNVPNGWEYISKWLHYPEQKPTAQTSTQAVWEVHDVPAMKEEPSMPAWSSVVSRMGVTFHPPSGNTTALGPTSWDQIGVWYSQLSADSIRSTPEIQQKVKDLTANATTWREKTEVLANYVQSQVRYIDIEIGIGGFQPHAAGDIYRHQYGDCKDKATLLSAMLHEAGIPSYLSLAQVYRGVISPEFASAITFNHAILAIPVPADASVKDFTAIVEAPRLGKLLMFDPTSEYTPFGSLPTYEQDNFVLVATPNSGELIHLPLADPSTNRLVRTAKLELHADGTLTGAVDETSYGSMAADERERLLSSSSTDRTKELEEFLGGFMRGFHLTKVSADNVERVGAPLMLHYEFTAERYAKSAGDLLVVRPRVLGEKGVDVAEGNDPRRLPVAFDDTSVQTDDFEIKLPAGYAVDDMPRPTHAETEFGSYVSDFKADAGTIHYTRNYQVKQVLVPLDKVDELKKFNRQIASDERASVVLKKMEQ